MRFTECSFLILFSFRKSNMEVFISFAMKVEKKNFFYARHQHYYLFSLEFKTLKKERTIIYSITLVKMYMFSDRRESFYLETSSIKK